MNLRLTGNEEVRVPVAGKIFVLGNIRKPGAFSVRDPADKTVLKMVALSEGLMPFSEKIAYIVRRPEGEKPQEIPIELAKIMERKSPDVPLEVGDILYVPDNKIAAQHDEYCRPPRGIRIGRPHPGFDLALGEK